LAFVGAVWLERFTWATWGVHTALRRLGVSDVSFRLTRLSPDGVTVEDVRFGGAHPVLAVDWLELRFSPAELRHGRIDRLRVRGVDVPLVVDGQRLRLPLQERVSALLTNRVTAGVDRAAAGAPAFSVPAIGEVSVYDLRMPLQTADGRELERVVCSGGVFAEADASRMRFWGDLRTTFGVEGRFSGSATPLDGAWRAESELKAKRVEDLVARLRTIAPDAVSAVCGVALSNVSATVRGSVSVRSWSQVTAFDGSLELGRGSGFSWGSRGENLRFQTFRVEGSGTPGDAQCRFSMGVSGFRLGGGLGAEQDDGRLLGARGTVRWSQSATNRSVRAVCDTDLPGRTAVQVLSPVLPLIPRLMTDGGSLHADADLTQPRTGGGWRGSVRGTAEARRSAATLPRGRLGVGRLVIGGELAVDDSSPGLLTTTVAMEDAYFVGAGVSARGGGKMTLEARPPYGSALGTFEGRATESAAVAASGLSLPADGVRFSGRAAVDGLVTNPVWRVAFDVPELDVSAPSAQMLVNARAGATVQAVYGASRFAFSGDAWVRDAAASSAVSRVAWGVKRASLHVEVPETGLDRASNVVVRLGVAVRGACASLGGQGALEDAEADVPLAWSQASGWSVEPGARLTWRKLESRGLRIAPGAFALRTEKTALEAALDASVEGSRLGARLCVRVPLTPSEQVTAVATIPETAWDENDAALSVLRQWDATVSASGRLAAEANIRFLGGRPLVEGSARLAGVQLTRGSANVHGLSAEVPFEYGVSLRTVGRPFVAFDDAQVGNIRLGKGRIEFQVTPDEVFVDRAEVACCQGHLRAYSIHLNPKRPKAEIIVYADRIDMGEALTLAMPFRGRMEGVLYGQFPVGIDGDRVRLSTGYLYSLPGQGGKLRLDGHAPVQSLLDQAGVKGEVQVPLAKALSDMDFSAVRFELTPEADGQAVLKIKVDGKSNFKEWPAPVDLELNLHGPLEKLLNVGLDMSRKR
jgi:hypothetical protein